MKHLLFVLFVLTIFSCGKDDNDTGAQFRNIPLNADGNSFAGWKQVFYEGGVAKDSIFMVVKVDSANRTASFFDRVQNRMRYAFQFDNSWKTVTYTEFNFSGNLTSTMTRDGSGRLENVKTRSDGSSLYTEDNVQTTIYPDSIKYVRRLISQKNPLYIDTEIYDKSNRFVSMSKLYTDSSFATPSLRTWDYIIVYDTDKHLTSFTSEEKSNANDRTVYELFAVNNFTYSWHASADFTLIGKIEKMIYGADLNYIRVSDAILPDIRFALGYQNMVKVPLKTVSTRTFYSNRGVTGSERTERNYTYQLNATGKISKLTEVSDKNTETRTFFYYN